MGWGRGVASTGVGRSTAAGRVQRVSFCSAILLSVCVPLLLVVRASLTGWVSPSWLSPAIGFAALAWAVSFVALLLSSTALKRQGITSLSTRSRFYGRAPRGVLVAAWTLLLIAGLVMVLIAGQQLLPAWQLGSSPSHATATAVMDRTSCARCSTQVIVTYQPAGVSVTATLAGVDGASAADLPGLALVYDPAHPDRVMRTVDWASGRHGDTGLLLGGLTLLLCAVLVPVLQIRRRRRKFGTLRPGVQIVAIRRQRRGRVETWRVEFADGTGTNYTDTPRFRVALRSKLADQGGTGLDLIGHAQLDRADQTPTGPRTRGTGLSSPL
jgi:hypothetical protein